VVLWFKRDVRLEDHPALHRALEVCAQHRACLLPLYVIEPGLWAQADASARQWRFISDGLDELATELEQRGSALMRVAGPFLHTLEALSSQLHICALVSHQETGNAWTFKRDLAVKRWLASHQIPWIECLQLPILRGQSTDLEQRNSTVEAFFSAPVLTAPDQLPPVPHVLLSELHVPQAKHNPFLRRDNQWPDEQTQPGGRSRGLALLARFIESHHTRYLQTIAHPIQARTYSSRLSAHLAWGSLSMREVIQRANDARRSAEHPSHLRNWDAFIGRLHWQGHFIQKLEWVPQLETQAQNPLYADLRPWNDTAQRHVQAWYEGQTGIPMVDAAMRCLRVTGWLPFRMRAMVISAASYPLWIPWQASAPLLAGLFTDYEPGIHYAQVQMQSGVTGINAMRVYNPVKQGLDHDPEGEFVRRWCPELRHRPLARLHQPHHPIVDLDRALKEAKAHVAAVGGHPEAGRMRKQVLKAQGLDSRARKSKIGRSPAHPKAPAVEQGVFNFEDDAHA
jgi:deoxyribodipyrimidine photo-lyase